MGDFLLILFIVFVVIPVVRVLWALFKAKRKYDHIRRQAREAFRQQYGGSQTRNPFGGFPFGSDNGGYSESAQKTQRRRGKKIPKDVGEYVNFEELPPLTDRCDLPPRHVRTEEQIVDAEWEDIR